MSRRRLKGWTAAQTGFSQQPVRAPLQRPDGTVEQRTKGTPQGGVISPLLANLFLHYAFDAWMSRTFPAVPFERYADDAIVHCRNERHANKVLDAIRDRLAQCGLELHPVEDTDHLLQGR
jgi:RNA-directed DNA polymerase